MGELLGGCLLAVALGVVVAVALSALLMLLGAKLAGVRDATFGKALLASIGATFVTWLIGGLCSVVPVVGTALGFLLGLALSVFVIQAVFVVPFRKALLTWVFNAVAQLLAVAVLGVVLGAGAVRALLR